MKITVPVTLRDTWHGPVKDIRCPFCKRTLTIKQKDLGVENPCSHQFYLTARKMDEVVAVFEDGNPPEAA